MHSAKLTQVKLWISYLGDITLQPCFTHSIFMVKLVDTLIKKIQYWMEGSG
jgi:hypothetical protein